MEKWLSDLDVYAWRFRGNPKNYSGYHLTATPAACEALLRMANLLLVEGPGSGRTVPLKAVTPDIVAKVDWALTYARLTKMRVRVVEASEQIRQMCFLHEGATLNCRFTPGYLNEFRDALVYLHEGVGDFEIGPDPHGPMGEQDKVSECLWFWACFSDRRVGD